MAAAAAARAAIPVMLDWVVLGAETGIGEARRGVVLISWATEVFVWDVVSETH